MYVTSILTLCTRIYACELETATCVGVQGRRIGYSWLEKMGVHSSEDGRSQLDNTEHQVTLAIWCII